MKLKICTKRENTKNLKYIVKMKNFFIKNWKTSVGGILIATAAFLKTKAIIDSDTLTYVIAIITSLGLIAAKDADQTGLSK